MCRYPFGSGGNRVCTRPPCLPVRWSSAIISRMKSPDSIRTLFHASKPVRGWFSGIDEKTGPDGRRFGDRFVGQTHEAGLLEDARYRVDRLGLLQVRGCRDIELLEPAGADQHAA